jgi:hypothetical protein
MAFLEGAIGASTAPARVVANPKPVMVNGHRGLIGTKAVRGFYDVQPAGKGGPFQKIAGLHKLNETLVVLTLSVPVANHVGDLAILEHGLSEKRLLSIVSSGLAADGALSTGARPVLRHDTSPQLSSARLSMKDVPRSSSAKR